MSEDGEIYLDSGRECDGGKRVPRKAVITITESADDPCEVSVRFDFEPSLDALDGSAIAGLLTAFMEAAKESGAA